MKVARFGTIAAAAVLFVFSFVAGGIVQSRAQHEGFCLVRPDGVQQNNTAFRAAQLIFLNTWTPQQTYAVWLVDASQGGHPPNVLGRVDQLISCAAMRMWYGEPASPGVARAGISPSALP